MEVSHALESSFLLISSLASSAHDTCLSVLEDVSLPIERKGEVPLDAHLSLNQLSILEVRLTLRPHVPF